MIFAAILRAGTLAASALVASALLVGHPARAADRDHDAKMVRLAGEKGCLLCHSAESDPPGTSAIPPRAPSFPDIAKRYRGQKDADRRLAAIVVQGSDPRESQRHWKNKVLGGEMFPNDVMVSPQEALELVRWILTLDGAPEQPGSKP